MHSNWTQENVVSSVQAVMRKRAKAREAISLPAKDELTVNLTLG